MNKKSLKIIIILIILLLNIFSCTIVKSAEITDVSTIEKDMELRTTRAKNIYKGKFHSKDGINVLWDSFDDTGKNIDKGVTVSVVQVVDFGGNTYIEVNFENSKNGGDSNEAKFIMIAAKDMASGGRGSGLETVTRTDDEKNANKEFKKKYPLDKVKKMDQEELYEARAEGQKLTAPDDEVREILEAIEKRMLDIGATPTGDTIYKNPQISKVDGSEQNLDDMVNDANDFVNQGEEQDINGGLQNFSKTMYNILLAIGIAVAVIVGGIIGIKLMTAGIEEKAEAKKLLVPYIVGCVAVFGAFGIWKLIVTIVSNI